MKRKLLVTFIGVGISIALSSNAIAESVFDGTNVTNVRKNVREIQDGYVVHTQPSGDSLTPLQTETTVTSGIQSDVLGKKAWDTYNTYIVPNAHGLPEYFPKLLISIIVDRNPMCDLRFDEGNGKPGYGYGLALITEATVISFGVTKDQLYDPNTNVQLAFQILSKLQAKYGDDVNKIVNHYINGDPNVTDPRSQKVLLLLKQLM